MAIDKMKKVTLLSPVTASQRLFKRLHELGLMEVSDTFDQYEEAKGRLNRQEVSTECCDRELQRINFVLGLLAQVAPEKKSFVQGLASVPLLVDAGEMNRLTEEFPLDSCYKTVEDLDTEYRRIERTIGETENRLKELNPFLALPFAVDPVRRLRRVRVAFGALPEPHLEILERDGTFPHMAAWEKVEPLPLADGNDGSKTATPPGNGKAWILAVFLPEAEEEARNALDALGFQEIPLPQVNGRVYEQIRALEGDLDEEKRRLQRVESKIRELEEHRKPLLLLKAWWEANRRMILARRNTAHGRWIQVVTGYMRQQDLPLLDRALKADFEGVTAIVDDPGEGDNPPVSLSLPSMIKPVQMLVDLFGRPAYNSFDPSPFIMPTFLIFFGICFSDVAYGTMLILFSLYIMRKTRPYAGIYNFARLLLYSGISTVVFGFLLGSWFGDLYKAEYLGENNIMLRIMSATQVIDPLEKPIVVLMLALLIGILNQFYGIILKMYGALLRGDKAEAFCDGLLWLVALPGFVVLVAGAFVAVPAPLFYGALLFFCAGALGLVLTQGRGEKGLFARITTGVVSLYGIVGTYGITAFIGDTMSYCRLLALALTTGIVALSFNMMAGLLRPIPYVGIFLFIFVLIVAHLFNFLISVLSAFVHAMRLIFVEFFGRFYATGSRPFSPLGFDSKSVILIKKK